MTGRAVILGVAFALLGGCAGLLAPRDYSDTEFAALLSEHHFAAAESYLARLRAADASSQRAAQLAGQLKAAQSDYRESVVARARAAQSQGHWREAADHWRAGLSELPDDPVLEQGRNRFAAERRERLDKLELELTELRADNLARKVALAQELAGVADEPAHWRRLRAGYQREAADLVSLLKRRAHSAEKRGDWYRARDEYRRLLSLAPDDDYRDAVGRVDKQITERERTAEQARQKHQRERYRELAGQFRKALADDDLRSAQQLLPKMRTAGGGSDAVASAAKELSGRIERRVESLVERGRDEYTRGNLDTAISAWNEALQLEPDSVELKNRIARARRFRDNVERLSH